jgi:hypothetical protein
MLCGISPAFAGLFPIGGQIAHVLRTRAPCAHPPYCYGRLRTRLACVKHAASVRSEPGSNSRLKPVAWRSTKNPVQRTGPACQAKLLVAQINSNYPSVLEARMGSNRFWHIVSVVKERLASLSSRVASNEPTYPIRPSTFVNTRLQLKTRFPHVILNHPTTPLNRHNIPASGSVFLSHSDPFSSLGLARPHASLTRKT